MAVFYRGAGFQVRGMKNNARVFEYMVIIRAINTVDAMTASVEKVDWDALERITGRILAEVENVNRVCYDMSSKPSATIELEKNIFAQELKRKCFGVTWIN